MSSSYSSLDWVLSHWAHFTVHCAFHTGIHLGPAHISCQNSQLIYTTRFIEWQPHHAADMSTNGRQSLFCRCTTSMEQAANGAETAAIDGLVLS